MRELTVTLREEAPGQVSYSVQQSGGGVGGMSTPAVAMRAAFSRIVDFIVEVERDQGKP